MAGASFDGDSDEGIVGINVTPLVDVVLVLLLIFIVTASQILRPALPLDLPRAATAEEVAQGLLAVAITREGALFLNGKSAGFDDLPAAVARARAARADATRPLVAFVSADTGAPYGRFAEVVDRLRALGVTEIAMDTKPGAISAPAP